MASFKLIRTVLNSKVSRKDELPRFFNEVPINLDKFLKDYVDCTKGLSAYFSLMVILKVYSDRTFEFSYGLPSVGFFLNLLSFIHVERVVYVNRVKLLKQTAVNYKEICFLCVFKFDSCTFEGYSKILSTAKTMGLFIEYV